MADTRTIDNLGIDTSVRWATDQEFLDKTIVKEAPLVSKQAKVDVYVPFYISEFDLIFETKQRHQQWAAFSLPPQYSTQKMRIFLHQVIPSLGTEDFQQTQMQKIRDRCATNESKRKKKQAIKKATEYAWEEQREEEEEKKESRALLDLIEYLGELDQLLNTINARRSQYSKG